MKFRYSGQAPPSFILHYFETCSTAQLKWIFFVLQTDKALSRLQRHKSLQQNTTCTKAKVGKFCTNFILICDSKNQIGFLLLVYFRNVFTKIIKRFERNFYTNVFLFIFSTESKKRLILKHLNHLIILVHT